jgi:hypothetical protein
MPGGKSALSSMGKAQRELAQGVQPPRGELKPVYGVADAPCRFETQCLTRPHAPCGLSCPGSDYTDAR